MLTNLNRKNESILLDSLFDFSDKKERRKIPIAVGIIRLEADELHVCVCVCVLLTKKKGIA